MHSEERARFWAIIEETRDQDDQDAQLEALYRVLESRTAEEVAEFSRTMDALLRESYRWDLWGAAYVIMGGASDDGFEYFRAWMISRGEEFFHAALENPDSMARLIPADYDEYPELESLVYVPLEVWTAKTGKEELEGRPEMAYPQEPLGDPFDDSEAGLAKAYPDLWKRFGESPLG